jgi:hypothetical protein
MKVQTRYQVNQEALKPSQQNTAKNSSRSGYVFLPKIDGTVAVLTTKEILEHVIHQSNGIMAQLPEYFKGGTDKVGDTVKTQLEKSLGKFAENDTHHIILHPNEAPSIHRQKIDSTSMSLPNQVNPHRLSFAQNTVGTNTTPLDMIPSTIVNQLTNATSGREINTFSLPSSAEEGHGIQQVLLPSSYEKLSDVDPNAVNETRYWMPTQSSKKTEATVGSRFLMGADLYPEGSSPTSLTAVKEVTPPINLNPEKAKTPQVTFTPAPSYAPVKREEQREALEKAKEEGVINSLYNQIPETIRQKNEDLFQEEDTHPLQSLKKYLGAENGEKTKALNSHFTLMRKITELLQRPDISDTIKTEVKEDLTALLWESYGTKNPQLKRIPNSSKKSGSLTMFRENTLSTLKEIHEKLTSQANQKELALTT